MSATDRAGPGLKGPHCRRAGSARRVLRFVMWQTRIGLVCTEAGRVRSRTMMARDADRVDSTRRIAVPNIDKNQEALVSALEIRLVFIAALENQDS